MKAGLSARSRATNLGSIHGGVKILSKLAVARRQPERYDWQTFRSHRKDTVMDLSTDYMGLKLSSPLVASAGPMGMNLDKAKQLADAGIAAITLNSLFEEQIKQEAEQLDHFLHFGENRFAESLSFYPQVETFQTAPNKYITHIEALKKAVDVPVIASLNGVSTGGWVDCAKDIEAAGADALELNICFLPTSTKVPAELVEGAHVSILENVVSQVSIPVAAKMSPFFSSPAAMAAKLVEAGAKGLVLFNRFYQPDIDVDEMEVRPRLALSTSEESRLPLRWIAILHGRVEASLAASTGIHTAQDVAKMLLAGADVACMTSALLKNGTSHPATVLKELAEILEGKGYQSSDEMRGALSHLNCPEPAAFERANYLKTVGCFKSGATRE